MLEQARLCLANPRACWQVKVAEPIRRIREHYTTSQYPVTRLRSAPPPSYRPPEPEGEYTPVDRRQARRYINKYGYTEAKGDAKTGGWNNTGGPAEDAEGQPVRHAGRIRRKSPETRRTPYEYIEEERYYRPEATQEDAETLGVDLNAPPEEVQRAYKKRAMEVHPDQHKNDPNATEKFKRVQQAYERFNPDSSNKHKVNVQKGGEWKIVNEDHPSVHDLRAQRRKRERAERDFIAEFCMDHPDQCKSKKRRVEARGFCDTFPEKCEKGILEDKKRGIKADPDMWKKHQFVGGMKRRNDIFETENTERERAAQVRKNIKRGEEAEFWASRPGRFINLVGESFYEGRDTSRHAIKGIGSGIIGLEKPQRYVPRPKKAYKPKRKPPRRYRMTASNAMRDVDAITSRIIDI